ncbi:MAG: hypothetical protein K1X57_02270 [Gemmataceae bacterium]|nr:hypothetical protein [Gemmataceae bacterium]
MKTLDKIVIVTRKTRLTQLLERFNSWAQARFYLSHMKLDPAVYEEEHEVYSRSLMRVRSLAGTFDRPVQLLERSVVPSFLFSPADTVVTVGPDGLVVNTAKYLNGQPLIAVNPDPDRNDGILLGFKPDGVALALATVFAGTAATRMVTMAEAKLNDGQSLLAFNDFLVGSRTHVSARYRLDWAGRTEVQSSSGILISTGAGSTGWLSSTRNMAEAVVSLFLEGNVPQIPQCRMNWDDPRLAFVVREPFASRSSGTDLSAGFLLPGQELVVESQMAEGGVIFSDGIESDALTFNAGAVARIRTAGRPARLVAGEYHGSHERMDNHDDRRQTRRVTRTEGPTRRTGIPA